MCMHMCLCMSIEWIIEQEIICCLGYKKGIDHVKSASEKGMYLLGHLEMSLHVDKMQKTKYQK